LVLTPHPRLVRLPLERWSDGPVAKAPSGASPYLLRVKRGAFRRIHLVDALARDHREQFFLASRRDTDEGVEADTGVGHVTVVHFDDPVAASYGIVVELEHTALRKRLDVEHAVEATRDDVTSTLVAGKGRAVQGRAAQGHSRSRCGRDRVHLGVNRS